MILLSSDSKIIDHGNLQGLLDDDHTQYALLSGRSEGQYLYGGIAASENLTFDSTSHATKGNINFNSNFLPSIDNTYTIGDSTHGLHEIWLSKDTDNNAYLYFGSSDCYIVNWAGLGLDNMKIRAGAAIYLDASLFSNSWISNKIGDGATAEFWVQTGDWNKKFQIYGSVNGHIRNKIGSGNFYVEGAGGAGNEKFVVAGTINGNITMRLGGGAYLNCIGDAEDFCAIQLGTGVTLFRIMWLLGDLVIDTNSQTKNITLKGYNLQLQPTNNQILVGSGVSLDCNTNGGYLKLRRVSQSAQPTPSVGELLVWRDTDDDKTYLVYNDTNVGIRRIEMT